MTAPATAQQICLTTALDVCRPHDVHTTWHDARPGIGIGDLLDDAQFLLDEGLEVEVVHNGHVLPVAVADTLALAPGDAVHVRVIPTDTGGGGGSNALQIIATVALIAAAMAAPYIAVELGIIASATGFAGGLISAGVMIGGSLLLSMIFPAVKPKLGQGMGQNAIDESPTYRWSAQGNPVEQGSVIPIVQGDVKDVLPFQLCSYISTDGAKQYYNALYLVGEGVLDDIYGVKINDNPVDNYPDVVITTRMGTADQAIIPEFDDVVQEYGVNAKLSDAWQVRLFSGTGITRIGIGLNAPYGLFYANDGGGLDPINVDVEFQYRLNGTEDWLPLMVFAVRDASRNAVLRYQAQPVGRAAESYEVRGRVSSRPTGDRFNSDIYWDYYHEIIADDFRLPHCALLAIKALPTEALSGSRPKVTCCARRATALLPGTDDAGTVVWAARPLANPVWAVLDMALAQRYGVGEVVANIDVASFARAAEWCDIKGIKGALYVDAPMNFETFLGYWGQLGRFNCDRVGTQLVCVSDRPEDWPECSFVVTSADIANGTMSVDYPNLEDRADGFEITYFDDRRGKTTIFAPGAHFWRDMDRPPSVAAITLYPCRDEATALRAGEYMNRCNRYLTRTVQLTVGWRALGAHVRRGKIMQLAADTLLNTQSGVVACATQTTVSLNRLVNIDAGQAYELVLTHVDRVDERTGQELVERLPVATYAQSITTDIITLAVPWRHIPSQGCSCAVGALQRTVRWYRISSVSLASDTSVTISGLEYADEIYADEGSEPQGLGAGSWPTVAGLNAALIPALEDGVEKTLVSLTWRGFAVSWRVYMMRLGVDGVWAYLGMAVRPGYTVRNLEAGYIYRFAVTPTRNPQDGATVDVDYRLGVGSGLVLDVYVGDDPVIVTIAGTDDTVQAIL